MSDETEGVPEKPDLRDYFAGCAMNALLSNPELMRSTLATAAEKGMRASQVTACLAYGYADAMLAERMKKVAS